MSFWLNAHLVPRSLGVGYTPLIILDIFISCPNKHLIIWMLHFSTPELWQIESLLHQRSSFRDAPSFQTEPCCGEKKIKILCGVLVCRWDVRFTTLKHSVACILHHEFCCVDLKINVNMEIVQDFCDCWVTVGTCLKHLSVAHPVFWTEWWHSGAISKTKCHVSNFFRLLICSGARMDFWTLPLCL